MTIARITASISAENTFSEWVFLKGAFNFSLSGTWSATVTLQRSFDGGTTPLDVETKSANMEETGEEAEGCLYRFGVKSTEYTSGTVVGRLSQ